MPHGDCAWDGKKSAQVDVKPFSKMQLWFSDNPDQQSLWPTTIQFSDEFYRSLEQHALPVDVRALRAFSNSARKLDLLFWITYRITRSRTNWCSTGSPSGAVRGGVQP